MPRQRIAWTMPSCVGCCAIADPARGPSQACITVALIATGHNRDIEPRTAAAASAADRAEKSGSRP